MPDTGPETTMATAYLPDSLYESWKEHAESLDMTTSRFIIQMVEAGRAKIEIDSAADDSIRELRQQNSDLRREIERERERVKELERRLRHTQLAAIEDYVEKKPGASTPEIIQHIADTVPGRVASQLDVLEGTVLEARDGSYYLSESYDGGSSTGASEGGSEA